MYFYSKTTRGMYNDSVHTPAQMPSDAVPVSATDYAALMKGQEQGIEIVPDADGKPTLRRPPQPTAEDIEKAAEQ